MIGLPKHGVRIRTLTTTYGAPQKNQIAYLTKISTGTQGVVRWVGKDDDTAIWVLCVFWIDGKKYFAKLAPTLIEEVDDSSTSSSSV